MFWSGVNSVPWDRCFFNWDMIGVIAVYLLCGNTALNTEQYRAGPISWSMMIILLKIYIHVCYDTIHMIEI